MAERNYTIRMELTDDEAWELKAAAARSRRSMREYVLDNALPSRRRKK